MSGVHVTAEEDACIASGACVLAAPTVFDQDDDGVVVVMVESPSDDELPGVREAVRSCPAAVLELHGD